MSEKKWDVYVYGDVNADIIIPGVEKLPAPGQEELVSSMETYVGGGAALFTLGCLLYTSPSPRDRTRSRMPSSA